VEVEAAIVLPAVTFLLLGLIQLGLLHQARIMAKYAAYRAVRHGIVKIYESKSDWIGGMERAAVAAALPILSYDDSGGEVLRKTDTPGNWVDKWIMPDFGGMPGNTMMDLRHLDLHYAEVLVCGPLQSDVSAYTYTVNGTEYVPFDNPEVGGKYLRTKLRIQLTLNYRMVIPFADWVIYYMWRGWKYSKHLHLGEGDRDKTVTTDRFAFDTKYDRAAHERVFIVPLRVQYAMRLHSDIPLQHLPTGNDCI
jgi:hypothetical protein